MPSPRSVKSKIQKHHRQYGFVKTFKWLTISLWYKLLNRLTPKINSWQTTAGNVLPAKKSPSAKQVFILASVPFYDIGGGQRSAQLAKTFSQIGFDVYYLFAADSSERGIQKIPIPTVRHTAIKNYQLSEFKRTIKKQDLVIIEFPLAEYLPLAKFAKSVGATVIYENIDNWETSLANGQFQKKHLIEFLAVADLLVGTAKPLVAQLKKYLQEFKIKKPVHYIPNAVDDTLFSPASTHSRPKDFISGEKTLIYYGSLWGKWFDWSLVFGLAKQHPSYSFLLIGDKSSLAKQIALAPKNVHFLGLKKQTDLPHYLAFCDIAILPFKVDQIVEYVSPLKVFEYIAMHKPVLATNLPEITTYPNVFCGKNLTEWSAQLAKINDQEEIVSKLKLDTFIKQNNWHQRCQEILKLSRP